MYKLPRFNSYNEEKKQEEIKDDDWRNQRISLPLPPAVLDFYNKYKAGETGRDCTSGSPKQSNEKVFKAIADLLRVIEPPVDVKALIDYLLDCKDLVKCQPTEEP
jgi:hypothetical protein